MATATAEHAHPAAAQAPPKVPPVKRAEPVLFEDIDKVLLVRVFGDDIDVSAAKAKALAQGIATAKAGDELELSRVEFDPAATGAQRKTAAVARAQQSSRAPSMARRRTRKRQPPNSSAPKLCRGKSVATYQQLQDDVMGWLNRQGAATVERIPGWVRLVETEIAETLRARCMVVSGVQQIFSPYITLPANFATMESIRDNRTGELLDLKDEWSGHWFDDTQNAGTSPPGPCTAYRLLHDCIEFLPHPSPDMTGCPQEILMGWYAKPAPLLLPDDTNPVLEQLYGVYLFGVLMHGAVFELDDDRAAQMDAKWQQAVTRANLWKQQSDYSGAPFRSELATVF